LEWERRRREAEEQVRTMTGLFSSQMLKVIVDSPFRLAEITPERWTSGEREWSYGSGKRTRTRREGGVSGKRPPRPISAEGISSSG